MNEAVIAASALAATLSAITVWLLRRGAFALPRDVPNARSLHARPVPRAGGYAVWVGFLAAAIAFAPAYPGGWIGWLPAWAALTAVSGLDDQREVRVVPRLAVHAGAALWAAAWLATQWPGGSNDAATIVPATIAAALLIAWSSNLYNFMDGTDGLAATMGAVGFTAYGLAAMAPATAAMAGAPSPHASAPAFFALAAAIVPFLAVNRPRASMFLGDVGAVPLGFLASAFGSGRHRGGRVACVVPAPRVPAVHRGCDADARAPRPPARAAVGGAPLPFLPAPAPTGRRPWRHTRRLRRGDGRRGRNGARLPPVGARSRLVGARCVVCCCRHVVRHD